MTVVAITFISGAESGKIGDSFTPFSGASSNVAATIAKIFYKILVFRPDTESLVPEKSIEVYTDMGLEAPADGNIITALQAWEYTPPFGNVEIYIYADTDAAAIPASEDPPEMISRNYGIVYPMTLGYSFMSKGPMRMKRNSKQFKVIQLHMNCAADPRDLVWDINILKHTDLSFPRRAAQNMRGVIIEEFSTDVYSGINLNLSDVTPEELIVQYDGLEVGILIDTESELFATYDIFYLQAIVTITGEVIPRQIASKLFPIILSDEVDRIN